MKQTIYNIFVNGQQVFVGDDYTKYVTARHSIFMTLKSVACNYTNKFNDRTDKAGNVHKEEYIEAM